jgi:hypothetical protein
MKIDYEKIINQAITALVVAVFIGAAAIMWKNSSSVDDKVQNTREDMQHLITALSDKLGGYEVQLVSLSNQLVVVINNQSNLLENTRITERRLTGITNRLRIPRDFVPLESSDVNKKIQQKAYSQDIQKQLKR